MFDHLLNLDKFDSELDSVPVILFKVKSSSTNDVKA